MSAPRRPGIEFTEGRAQWVAHQVSTLRGIPMPESAPVEQRSRRELAQEYDRLARESLDTQATERRIRADIAFGFLPKEALGKSKMFTLADVGIAGTYDPETKKIVVLNDLEGGRHDDRTLAHELTHYLDDSRFDLQSISIAARGNSDRALAVRSLIEGSAMVTSFDYALAERFEDVTGTIGGFTVSRAERDLESEMGLLARAPRDRRRILLSTPAYMRERIIFPYSRGLVLGRSLRLLGGTAAMDEAFRNPPRSTEQILHPEKLLERRDDPVEIELPDRWLSDDAKTVHEDTLGELGIRQLLATSFSKAEAYEAAADWGGDRFRVVETGGRDVLLWHTEWDNERAARLFAQEIARFYAKRHRSSAPWMSELRWGEIPRADGAVVQIRRRGRSVGIVDGAPADGNWVDPLLDQDRVTRPEPPPPRGAPLGFLVSSSGTETSSDFRLLGGVLASSRSHGASSSFHLLGGALFSRDESCDGTETSLLFGLISWRTAPRQDLTRVRFLISGYGSDADSVAWSLIPIVNAPAYSSATGHQEIRTGLWNSDRTYRVTFDPKGTPTNGERIGSDESVLLGLFGHGWYEDHEPDGTPLQSESWYGPTAILFSTVTSTRGPLGPRYAAPPSSAPASGPASAPTSGPASRPAGRLILQPGDIEESSRWQLLGDILVAHETQRLLRDGRVAGQRTDWNVFLGILSSGGVRDEKWWFQTPLAGWAEAGNRRYLLFFWGAIPILISRDEPPEGSRPADTLPAER